MDEERKLHNQGTVGQVSDAKRKKRNVILRYSKGRPMPILIIVLLVIAVLILGPRIFTKKGKPQIFSVASLEKILNISELSTYQSVYNGISEVRKNEDSDNPDYYVSYDAKVNAGFDFEKLLIKVDDQNKKIVVTLPEIQITEVNVEIASMDYIFLNKKANTSTVSSEAYKACIDDVTRESSAQKAIIELAHQNAVNIVKALLNPFIEQMDLEYKLEVY